MPRIEREQDRENYIELKIVAGAYNEVERALAWYAYLQENLHFPFNARCVEERDNSPLLVDEVVEVVGMPPASDHMCDILVQVRWSERTFAVPLAQLKALDADAATQEGTAYWNYWVARGYQF